MLRNNDELDPVTTKMEEAIVENINTQVANQITSEKNTRKKRKVGNTNVTTKSQILEKRRQRNRASASTYRLKQKARLNSLTERIEFLENENKELKQEIARLNVEITPLQVSDLEPQPTPSPINFLNLPANNSSYPLRLFQANPILAANLSNAEEEVCTDQYLSYSN